MKKFIYALTLLYFVSANAFALQAGDAAPDFTAADTKGQTVKISDLQGRIVVLEWRNHECPFSKKHYEGGNMQGLQKFATENNIAWFTIISSAPGKQGHVTPEQANEIAAKANSLPAGIILDEKGDIGKLYGAKTTPHMFVIDKKGQLAYMGAIDDKDSANAEDVKGSRNFVKEAMEALLAGREPSVQYVQQYGCSVKY